MTTAEQELQSWQTPEYSSTVTIGEFFRTLRRNAAVFWATFFAVLLIGAAYILLSTPRYAAAAQILVEGASPTGGTASPENILGELTVPGSAYPLATLVEMLQSQEVLFQVLDASAIPLPRTVEELQNLPTVTVRQQEESNIFVIRIEGTNRDQVTRMAQNYPNVFQRYVDAFRTQAANRGVDWVSSRIEEDKAALRAAESEFANFKSQNQVVDSNAEAEFRLNLVTATEQALAESKATAAAAIAAVDQARRDLANTPKVRSRINDANNENVLIAARANLQELRLRREQLLDLYLPSAPQVQEVDRQLASQEKYVSDLEGGLRPTIQESNPEWDIANRNLSNALANRDAAVSRMREIEQLASARNNRLNQLAQLNKSQREYETRIALLNQSIANNQQLLDRARLRANELKSSVVALTRSVFAPQSAPNIPVISAITAILAIVLATVFALVRDSLQDKVNSKEEAFILSGLSLLAHIPERARSKHPIITNPQTNMAFEAYRVLRSAISVHARRVEMRSLTVTSTLRKEGKSVVAANLAVAYVLNGQKTILVDANLRYPSLNTLFGVKEKPGLGDLLLGTASLEEVLQPTSVENLFVVSAGTIPANSTEVIGSPRMVEIVEQLEAASDIVIFDGPHSVGLADAPSLASVTDAAILVTQIRKPSKSELKEAVALLEASSPALLGMVENRVSAREAHLTKL